MHGQWHTQPLLTFFKRGLEILSQGSMPAQAALLLTELSPQLLPLLLVPELENRHSSYLGQRHRDYAWKNPGHIKTMNPTNKFCSFQEY